METIFIVKLVKYSDVETDVTTVGYYAKKAKAMNDANKMVEDLERTSERPVDAWTDTHITRARNGLQFIEHSIDQDFTVRIEQVELIS